jgi:hypothetical protein
LHPFWKPAGQLRRGVRLDWGVADLTEERGVGTRPPDYGTA